MLKRIKSKINNILEKIGFHYVGYKVYISEIMRDIKQLKKDINRIDDIKTLDERIKALENNNNDIDDVKIDNIINDGLIIEFANYITDNIDVFDYYEYGEVKRSVLSALLECKQYNIKVERVKK